MSLANLETADGRKWTVLPGSTILFPLRGIWTGRIVVDADEDDPLPGGRATISLAADDGDDEERPPVQLVGTIAPDNMTTFEGRATALLVAGAGTLATTTLEAKCYQQAPLEVPVLSLVQDAADESGEQTAGLETSLFGLTVERWQRVGGRTAAQLLSRLAEDFALGWRLNDAGELEMAAEEWAEADLEDAEFFEQGPEDAINRTIAGTVGRASIRPGTVVNGRRIEEACYELDENGLRVLLRYGPGEGAGGLRGDLDAQAQAALPPLAYRELHAATVRRQNQDGTLDLDADDPRIGGITAVPYLPGIVGCRLIIPEGERVRLGFEGGDERRPFATGWDRVVPDPLAEDSGLRGVGRVDDPVNVGTLAFAAAAGSGGIASITITYTPPVGTPTIITVSPASPASLPLTGRISAGSPEVFIRGN